jgi:hypothetical protein
MVLTEEQTNQLLNNETVYDCRFAKHRFGFEFFQADTSPLGSILCFEYPTKMGAFKFQQAINICVELPDYNYHSAICFERLYLTQIGSIISNALQIDCFVNENSLFIEDKQLSIALVKSFPLCTLLHITIPTKTKYKQFSKLENIAKDIKSKLMNDIVSSFQFLTKSIFLESQHNII